MTLLHLAPAIQEHLLFLAVKQTSPISEAGLRRIAREPRWDRQSVPFLIPWLSGNDAFNLERMMKRNSRSKNLGADSFWSPDWAFRARDG